MVSWFEVYLDLCPFESDLETNHFWTWCIQVLKATRKLSKDTISATCSTCFSMQCPLATNCAFRITPISIQVTWHQISSYPTTSCTYMFVPHSEVTQLTALQGVNISQLQFHHNMPQPIPIPIINFQCFLEGMVRGFQIHWSLSGLIGNFGKCTGYRKIIHISQLHSLEDSMCNCIC